MEHLVVTFGYWAIAIGTFLEGETILIIGGFVAHRGWLELPYVMLSAFVGSFLGDQLYFFLGRSKGQELLQRKRHWRARLVRVRRLVRRRQNLIILSSRFLYGLRIVIPLVVGTAGVHPVRFIVLDMIGAAIWAVAFGFGGWYLGEALESLFHHIENYELAAIASIAAVGAIVALLFYWRSRRRDTKEPAPDAASAATAPNREADGR